MIAAVIGVSIYGYVLVSNASYAVGGSDSSGYANIARSILRGETVRSVDELEKLDLPPQYARLFVPLGYQQIPGSRAMRPTYPIGFPLHITAGVLIAGWNYGPYLVSPLSAVLCLAMICLLGLELGLPRGFSIAGAAMLAASPTFIFMAEMPMSDVTAALWSVVAIFASLRSGKRAAWALLAGSAFGMGFLVRPSGILLLVPLSFCLAMNRRTLLFFILGGLPLAALFFGFNLVTYGNPLQTGYVSTGHIDLMTSTGFAARFKFYAYWMSATLSSLLLLGWLGAAVNRKLSRRVRAALIGWFGSFLLFYSFYDIYDDWWYTRFLLPAYPALILGALLSARDFFELFRNRFSERNRARLKWVALAALLAASLGAALEYDKRFKVFNLGKGESVHPNACRMADRAMPDRALVVSVEMSGALKFYTGRPIIRWDQVEQPQWQLLRKQAEAQRFEFYALLMPQEVEDARNRMPGKWGQIGSYRHITLWHIATDSQLMP
jgi:hypothetical protein